MIIVLFLQLTLYCDAMSNQYVIFLTRDFTTLLHFGFRCPILYKYYDVQTLFRLILLCVLYLRFVPTILATVSIRLNR